MSSSDEFRETNKFLSPSEEADISKTHHISYVFTTTKDNLTRFVQKIIRPSTITEIKVTDENLDLVVAFIKKNYYQKFGQHFSAADINVMAEGSRAYYAMGILGKLYEKEGTIVGCFLANRMEKHNLLPHSSVHFGYSGYDRNLLAIEDARYIRNNWLELMLSLHQGNDVFDASIHSFNENALSRCRQFGANLEGVRLQSKKI